MLPPLHKTWQNILNHECAKDYFKQLLIETQADYLLADPSTYPPAPLLYNAFNLTPFDTVRVVILGQDPYHSHGQAMGLSFSVPDGVPIPPSLRNIYKEIKSDVGDHADTAAQQSGDLTRLATQGVLLLNATLTVAHKQAGSHQGRGWETFTDAVIKNISDERQHVVFMLWGAYAGKKATLIDDSKHLVLTAPHPSPLSAQRGFVGCRHFSQCNEYVREHGLQEIKW